MEIFGLEEYFDLKDEGMAYCYLAEAGGLNINEKHLGEEKVSLLEEKHIDEAENELKKRERREERREDKICRGVRRILSNNREKLEHLFHTQIEVRSEKQRRYLRLLKFVMNFLVDEIKRVVPKFRERLAQLYCGGSFFDGLKTDSQPQEFDMNIIFRYNPDFFHLCELGDYKGKENFCFLRAGGTRGCPYSMHRYVDFLSPVDMFKQLLSAVDKVISNNNNVVKYNDGLEYRITRSVRAPVTLKVEGLQDDIKFEVDLVPAVKIPRQKLYQREKHFQVREAYRETSTHIQAIRHKFGCTRFELNDFLAIALHKADKEKFELDFHDLERKILKNRGCVKKVIMLIKYLRDIQRGAMKKIWSHLIKVWPFE